MDEVTQQNAALVEEAAAAAEAMREQAQGLAKTVSVFKLADTKNKERSAAAKPEQRQTRTTTVAAMPLNRQRTLAKTKEEDDWDEF
jgi:hypothetical protein